MLPWSLELICKDKIRLIFSMTGNKLLKLLVVQGRRQFNLLARMQVAHLCKYELWDEQLLSTSLLLNLQIFRRWINVTAPA